MIEVQVTRLWEQFSAEMTALKGQARWVSRASVGEALRRLFAERSIRKAVCCRTPALEAFLLRELPGEGEAFTVEWFSPLRGKGFDEQAYRRSLASCDAGIAVADYLIAQTGTAVLLNQHQPARLITLLPPTVILLADARNLLPDLHALEEVLAHLREGEGGGVTLITGPSRTADIEKTLVLGAHGPKSLEVIVVGED